ncbi:restriction endonuclease subunit S [Endozoicomonas arenosclerae]|uniref:restriction endonuclease subunit S n=1 Tax=Endozoicomonas arenosclerae TaxID=1633495 RepID=UPI00078302C2|nr:restriction endonuclease subunit S [Endozoicomonas arenosclerae]
MTELAAMPRYEAYKDSGVEGAGIIPANWAFNRIKNEIVLLTGYPFKSEKYTSEGIKLARGINVKQGVLDWKDTQYWPEITSELKQYLLKAGDILIGMDGSKVGKNFCWVANEELPILLLQRVARLRTKEKLDSRFLYWNLACNRFLNWVNQSKTDPMVPHIAPKDIQDYQITFPSVNEQKAIAAYLDTKTTQIDQAITIKEQQIELLKERRQILIQNAVTHGLDPQVPMRDSGVEWIGEIPAHWEVVANRSLFKERVEPGREGLPLLMVSIHSGVSDDEVSDEENIRGRVKIEDKTKYNLVKPGDIVFNMMRAWQGAIGAVRVDGMVSPAYIIATPIGAINSKFYEYQYRSPIFIQQMDRFSKGITDFRKRLYWDEYKQLLTILPPEDEQKAIVAHIEVESDKIDKAITLQQQQIEKLKEYRATLINSAVTGKIKVTPLT